MANSVNSLIRGLDEFNGTLIKQFTLAEDLRPDDFIEMDVNGKTYKIKAPPGQDIIAPEGTVILAARDEKGEWYYIYPEPTIFEGYTTAPLAPDTFGDVTQYRVAMNGFNIKIKPVREGWTYFDGEMVLTTSNQFAPHHIDPEISAADFKTFLESIAAELNDITDIDVQGTGLMTDDGFDVSFTGTLGFRLTVHAQLLRGQKLPDITAPTVNKFVADFDFNLEEMQHTIQVYNPDPLLTIDENKYCIFHKVAGLWIPIMTESVDD